MKYIYLVIVISIVSFSCSKDTGSGNNAKNEPTEVSSQNSLDDWEVGDTFEYVHFSFDSYYDPDNGEYALTADTLLLEVWGSSNGQLFISEKLKSTSAVFEEENPYIYNPDSTYNNVLEIRNDSLFIEPFESQYVRSFLFHSQRFRNTLNPFTQTEVEMNGWKTTEGYHESIKESYVVDAVISENIYPQLNVYTYNAGMAVDGPGFMYFYNRDYGMIRTASYSWWTSTGNGWELVEE